MATDTRRHSATLWARGVQYRVTIIDDQLATDPTLLIFRENEEEAIVTAHLDPRATCNYFGSRSERIDGHIVVREEED